MGQKTSFFKENSGALRRSVTQAQAYLKAQVHESLLSTQVMGPYLNI